MPRQGKLTKKDLEYFKKLLVTLRGRISNDMGNIEADYLKKSQKDISGDLSGYSLHMADMAADATDAEFNIKLAENEHEIVKEIDDALKRIDDGTYGICEKYGTYIPKQRLKAIPWARYSVKAQEEIEKGGK